MILDHFDTPYQDHMGNLGNPRSSQMHAKWAIPDLQHLFHWLALLFIFSTHLERIPHLCKVKVCNFLSFKTIFQCNHRVTPLVQVLCHTAHRHTFHYHDMNQKWLWSLSKCHDWSSSHFQDHLPMVSIHCQWASHFLKYLPSLASDIYFP